MLAQEIENDKESWLERAKKNLEDKLEKSNRDLSIQKKMTGHYNKLNQFSRRKLKLAQEKLKAARKRCLVEKVEKGTSRLEFLASASLHAFKNP